MCDSYPYRTRLLSPSRRSGRFDGWAVWPRKERSGEGGLLTQTPLAITLSIPLREPPERSDTSGVSARQRALPVALRSRNGRTELLGPPIGLALVHLRLELADVLGEIALLLAQPELELADGLLALLELDLAQLRVRLEARPAGLDLGLALLELALPVGDRLLGLAQSLLAAVDPCALRLEQRLRARDLGLAGGELPTEIVEPARLLLEVRSRLALGLVALHLRLAAVQLGLPGGELALLRGDLGALRTHRGHDLSGAGALFGEPLEIGGEPVG